MSCFLNLTWRSIMQQTADRAVAQCSAPGCCHTSRCFTSACTRLFSACEPHFSAHPQIPLSLFVQRVTTVRKWGIFLFFTSCSYGICCCVQVSVSQSVSWTCSSSRRCEDDVQRFLTHWHLEKDISWCRDVCHQRGWGGWGGWGVITWHPFRCGKGEYSLLPTVSSSILSSG